jgi:hypothetical protein
MQHPSTTTFAHAEVFVASDPHGRPRLVIEKDRRLVTVATFEELTEAGDDGFAEAWANARYVASLLNPPAPVEHVNAFEGFGAVIDAAIAEYEAGRRG